MGYSLVLTLTSPRLRVALPILAGSDRSIEVNLFYFTEALALHDHRPSTLLYIPWLTPFYTLYPTLSCILTFATLSCVIQVTRPDILPNTSI